MPSSQQFFIIYAVICLSTRSLCGCNYTNTLGYMQTMATLGKTMTVAIAIDAHDRGDKDFQHDVFLMKIRSMEEEKR